MIEEIFHVSNEERMDKVKYFIRHNMPTARFKSNPYRLSNGEWQFNITYEFQDINKLSKLLNEFYHEDNPPEPKKIGFLPSFIKWHKENKVLSVLAYLAALGIVFVLLKLFGAITWSWWLVTLPFYIMPVGALSIARFGNGLDTEYGD